MSDWIFVKEIDSIKDYVGFVYIITEIRTGQYYIGQKKFWSKRKLKPLKGKKRSRHKIVESDWEMYWGSSKEFLEFVNFKGENRFIRNIIHLCKSKAQMNYLETKEQFDRGALLDDSSFNKIINCRINYNQLKKVLGELQ